MGLPTSRDLSFVDGSSPVPAAVLNDIQDAIIRHELGMQNVPYFGLDDDFLWLDTVTSGGAIATAPWWSASFVGNGELVTNDDATPPDGVQGLMKMRTADGNTASATIQGHKLGIGTRDFLIWG